MDFQCPNMSPKRRSRNMHQENDRDNEISRLFGDLKAGEFY